MAVYVDYAAFANA